MDATWALLAEEGVDRLTIEAVAHRSGVAKTTIYRHWASKADLVVDTIRGVSQPLPTPNTGDLRADLSTCLRQLRDAVGEPHNCRIMSSLLAASWHNPEFAHLHERLNDERDQPLHTVLELAQLRGELPEAIDLDEVTWLLIGPQLARLLLNHERPDDAFLDQVVDTVLGGLRAPLAGSA